MHAKAYMWRSENKLRKSVPLLHMSPEGQIWVTKLGDTFLC